MNYNVKLRLWLMLVSGIGRYKTLLVVGLILASSFGGAILGYKYSDTASTSTIGGYCPQVRLWAVAFPRTFDEVGGFWGCFLKRAVKKSHFGEIGGFVDCPLPSSFSIQEILCRQS